MNTIEQLFEFILTKGCGIDFASFMKSQSFLSLLQKQQSLFRRYRKNTDKGTMLRAGHLVGGVVLNCYPEDQAITRASANHSKYGHGTEMRALITATGKAIISAAKNNLPEEAYSIAKKWQATDADGQVALTKELYYLFHTHDQRQKKQINYHNIWDTLEFRQYRNERVSGFSSVLPLGYGKWNKTDNLANCQGKSQMLVAFAQMVSAKVLIMMPNEIARDSMEQLKLETSYAIAEDISERNIKFPDPSFMESLHAGILAHDTHGLTKSFHICPVIQIKDGRWVVLDSNSLNWGILSDKWDLKGLQKKLQKYEEVLPGLSLAATDYEQRDTAITTMKEKIAVYIEHSKKMQALLDPITDIREIIETLANSEEFDFLYEHGFKYKIPADMPIEGRVILAADLLFGKSEAMLNGFLADPTDFLERKKGCVYTFYHSIAIDLINDDWNDNGIIVHPEAYFTSNAEYQLAISALNAIAIDERVAHTSAFLAEYCFCQTTLHNAMIGKNEHADLAKAAAQAILQLPYQHALSKKFLKYK